MNCPCEELFGLYEDMLNLHIKTKTTDLVFHKESAGFYEIMFSVFHDIAEAMQDGKMSPGIDWIQARKEAYDILMKTKSMIEKLVNENKDIAMDNVLRWLVDKLWFNCGASRALLDWEAKAEEPSNQEPSEKEEPEEESADDVSDYWMKVEVEMESEDEEEEDEEEEEEPKKKPEDEEMW